MGLPETMKLYAEMVVSDFVLLNFGFRCCLCFGVEKIVRMDVWLWCSKIPVNLHGVSFKGGKEMLWKII